MSGQGQHRLVLIDSHSHFDVSEFDSDRAEALGRARAAGVTRQIIPAIALAGFRKLRDVCASEVGLFPAYGLHPMFLAEHAIEHLDELAIWIARERPVAVGECGLDFHVDGLDPDSQRLFFRRQLELAREHDLPVIIHARRAVEEVIATIRAIGNLRGVIHSYSGSLEQARQLWDVGFLLGFGGPLTYDRATRLRHIVAEMPLEFLLIETDSPDQPLASHRGERNEPAFLPEILETIAELRGEAPETIANATTANAERLFGLTSDPG
ncbi:MAG: TatD family hydrolase [Dokdonella sp.]